jgi:hypothetical protein
MMVIDINAGWCKKNMFLTPKPGFSQENGHVLCVCDYIFYKFE